MKRTLMALVLGTTLLPAISLAHDDRRWDPYSRHGRFENREARPGDPGYYSHTHKRKIHKDDTRRHCHSIYNDEHNQVSRRDYPDPWWWGRR